MSEQIISNKKLVEALTLLKGTLAIENDSVAQERIVSTLNENGISELVIDKILHRCTTAAEFEQIKGKGTFRKFQQLTAAHYNSEQSIWAALIATHFQCGAIVVSNDPEPGYSAYSHSFTGFAQAFENGCVSVKDTEDNYWDLESSEIASISICFENPHVNYTPQLLDALIASLEYIDAIPDEFASRFPAMPGFDRDLVNQLINNAKTVSFA